MRRFVAMVGFALGCGASQPAAPPPSNTPPPPPPPSAIGDTVVDHLRAYRDDMCTCADRGCAREVDHEMNRWHDHHKEVDRSRLTSAEAEQLEHQIDSCATKAKGSASADGDMMVAMTRFTTEMCDCADAASADCAKKVTDEMTKWAVAHADTASDTSARPTEEETDVMKRFTECATKAMMSGMQQPGAP